MKAALTFFGSTVFMALGGLLWIIAPSVAIYLVGVAYAVPNPMVSATNAFIFWMFIHAFVIGYARVRRAEVHDEVESYLSKRK